METKKWECPHGLLPFSIFPSKTRRFCAFVKLSYFLPYYGYSSYCCNTNSSFAPLHHLQIVLYLCHSSVYTVALRLTDLNTGTVSDLYEVSRTTLHFTLPPRWSMPKTGVLSLKKLLPCEFFTRLFFQSYKSCMTVFTSSAIVVALSWINEGVNF